MGIIANALAGGAGDGMQFFAQQMASNQRYDADREYKREQLAQQREEFLDRLRQQREIADMRYGEDSPTLAARADAAAAKAGKKGSTQFEDRPDLYGANPEKTDRAPFVSQESTFSRDDAGPDSFDPRIRREAPLNESISTKFDEKGWNSAEDKRISTNIKRKAMVDNPDKYDDLEKGRGQGIINDLLERANAASTPAERDDLVAQANKQSMAKDGKERFKVQGNTVVDTATGDNTATDVGESVADKNRRAPTGKGGGGNDSNATRERVARVASLRTQDSNLSREIIKLQEGFVTPAKQAKIDQLTSERADIKSRLRAAEDGLGGQPAPKGDNGIVKPKSGAPAPSGKKDFSKLW